MDDLQSVFNIAEQDQVNVTNYYAFYHDLDEREPSQIYRPEDETLALAQVRLKKNCTGVWQSLARIPKAVT